MKNWRSLLIGTVGSALALALAFCAYPRMMFKPANEIVMKGALGLAYALDQADAVKRAGSGNEAAGTGEK